MTLVRSGADRVAAGDFALPRRGRLAILSNLAARTSDDRWIGDAVRAAGYPVSALLSPEHGLEAAAGAGEAVPHTSRDGVPVLSMYGADPDPVREALSRADWLLVDLPDVGCRYYTYGWTLREALKLAEDHDLPVTVLDRPNPLGGLVIEGNLPERVDSPVCAARVPVRHGLTLGELALWHRHALSLDVEIGVAATAGWRRSMLWPDTGLRWHRPSPALGSFDAALAYPGTCLLEGTNVSEGRGTDSAFLLTGAPFVDGTALARTLNAADCLAGATAEAARFTPRSGKWASLECSGIRLALTDRDTFRPLLAGLALVAALSAFEGFAFRPSHFDALAGTSSWRAAIATGQDLEEITRGWGAARQHFIAELHRAIDTGSLYPS